MREETEIAVYAASANSVKYDNAVKNLFKNKEILAPILKYVVSEYKDYSIEDIIKFIDADTISVNTPVSDIPIDAVDRGTEFASISEKVIRYDVHLKSKNPELSDAENDILIMIFVDFEVQNNYRPANPSYPVIKRAIYYAARNISRQLGTVTEKTNYSNLQKVYSIWVCNENIPKNLQNTATRYTIQKQDIIGVTDEPASEYDLLNITIVRRGGEASGEDIFKYLSAVFSADLAGIKEHTDVNSYKVIEQEVSSMSGLGQSIMERGIEQGDLMRLIKTTYKKMLKGKTNEEISDEVEEDISLVGRIIETILEERRINDGGEFDAKKVLEIMGSNFER